MLLERNKEYYHLHLSLKQKLHLKLIKILSFIINFNIKWKNRIFTKNLLINKSYRVFPFSLKCLEKTKFLINLNIDL